jgi:hypothetical protein
MEDRRLAYHNYWSNHTLTRHRLDKAVFHSVTPLIFQSPIGASHETILKVAQTTSRDMSFFDNMMTCYRCMTQTHDSACLGIGIRLIAWLRSHPIDGDTIVTSLGISFSCKECTQAYIDVEPVTVPITMVSNMLNIIEREWSYAMTRTATAKASCHVLKYPDTLGYLMERIVSVHRKEMIIAADCAPLPGKKMPSLVASGTVVVFRDLSVTSEAVKHYESHQKPKKRPSSKRARKLKKHRRNKRSK